MQITDLINHSGYPLQIKLQHLVAESWDKRLQQNWLILFDEHHWINGDQEGYVDLVLRSSARLKTIDIRLIGSC